MTLTNIILDTLPFLTIFAQILIPLLFIALLYNYYQPSSKLALIFYRYKFFLLALALITSLTATSGSLFYSEIMKFQPCLLCWYQRIFFYPQTILLFIALIKKDYKIAIYSLTLSIFGIVIAIYQSILQLNPSISIMRCEIGASYCTDKIFTSYGYITIPIMSATAFMLVILCMLHLIINNKKQNLTKN